MLSKTSTPLNLLDVMQELGILDCSFLSADGGEWIRITDRKTLYHAAIIALIEAAEDEGFVITREYDFSGEPIRHIHVDNAPESEPCDQLGAGCTCESCTAQIADVACPEGWDCV